MPAIYTGLKPLLSKHLLLVIVFCFLSLTARAQPRGSRVDPSLSLPNPLDVERVTIKQGGISAYTPETLMKLLPYFVATEGLYLKRKFPQRGTFVLKNGDVLHWMAWDRYSIELQRDNKARLFVVPAECSLTAPEKGLPLRPPGASVFHHTGDIYISNYWAGSAVTLGYMPLEDKLDRENAPGLSAEFKCVDGRASTTLSLKFWATRRSKGQPLSLMADGRLIKRIVLGRPADASLEDFGLVVYAIQLPKSLFLKMIEAKTVLLVAGREMLTLKAEHLEALRDLASRMER
jgi:hypothetical protein